MRMVDTMSAEDATKKWAARAAVATPDFTQGVERSADWQGNTLNAKDNYNAGVQKAVAEDKFAKGVNKTTTADWRQATKTKGAARWSAGVAAAKDDFKKGIGEVLGAIQATSLPARGPKGSEQNFERSKTLGKSLHEKFG